ncbi:tyrosine-type recombinase/integrase [Primorskyibacter sp. S87]|uniref:tyrosine-type recombinase/integrase n=1 Tax=Primorskyibacter sp. S87 TaxID=3415126 RepID=UPI003C7A4A1A
METKSNVVVLPPEQPKPKPKSKTVRLTAPMVRALKPKTKRYLVFDNVVIGLAVRVFPSGSKSYYLTSRVGKGRTARKIGVTLGDTGSLRLAEARDLARKRLAEMREGVDVNARPEAQASLSELLDAYEKRLAARQVVRAKDEISAMRRGLRPYLKRPGSDLSRKQIVSQMNKLEVSGKPGAATYLRKCASAFLNWCVNADHLKANVLAGYRRERQTRAEALSRPKVTFIGDHEIRAFWAATEGLESVFRDFCRFLLLTGARRTEAAQMTWGQIEGGAWACPAVATKMGREHRVPLGPMSCAIIEAQERYAATDLVFPGRRLRPMSGWTQRLQPLKDQLGEGFAFHALRRSYRTGLTRMGVDYDVAEMMIAHKRADLHGRYDSADLWTERVDAQARWEAYVAEVVA